MNLSSSDSITGNFQRNIRFWIAFLVLILLSSYLLFFQLDAHSLRLWDESLYGINAIEMSINGDFIVKYSNGQPDMWNVKPPLMIWAQVACMKVFGYDVLALRLPIAISGLLTILLLLHFCRKHMKDNTAGFLAALVLLASPGFVTEHGTRTGDHDVPLALFMAIGCLYFHLYVEKTEQKGRFLAISTIGFIAACLTKGIMGLMFLPGLLTYLILRKKLKATLLDKRIWIAIVAFLFFVLGYYILREIRNPGYLAKVWQHELGGRYFSAIEGHSEKVNYYWVHLKLWRFVPWIFFLPITIILIIRKGSKPGKMLSLYLGLSAILFFFVISGCQTKLIWYDIPLLPILSIIVGLGLAEVFRALIAWLKFKGEWSRFLFACLVCYGVFSPNYSEIRDKNHFHKEHGTNYSYGYVIERMEKIAGNYADFKVFEPIRNPALTFYQKQAEVERERSHEVTKSRGELHPGEAVLVCKDSLQVKLNAKFQMLEIANQGGCSLYEILGPR